jgi:DNA-binding NarL/FixJ family response regulator
MSVSGAGGDGVTLDVLLAIFDFPMLTAGYHSVIQSEPDIRVVGAVEDRAALREQLGRLQPDVVVAECQPAGITACARFETIEEIRAASPSAGIIAIECRCGSEQFATAIKAGAGGFLGREAEATDILAAIRCVGRGETYVSPAIVTRMVNTYVRRTPDPILEDVYTTLSDRERQVLLLAAIGHTNREIARSLDLSEQTIHHHRATVMEKLGFHDRVELLKYAIRRGVLTVADL